MTKNYKDKFKEFYDKIKAVKNIEIIIAVVVIAMVILIYSFISTDKKQSETKANNQTISDEANLTIQMEQDLINILSQIKGAGEVRVMITYNGSTEKVIANTKSTHTNNSNSGTAVTTSTNTVTETPIIISANGVSRLYVIKEIMPAITGVIVVAEGASSAKVRLELMRAVQTLLDINANSIEIFAMK